MASTEAPHPTGRIRRLTYRRRPWTDVAVGSAGVILGLGIGMPHVTRIGLDVGAVTGLACLVAGIRLLIAGISTLVRRLRGWWRLLALPGVGALAFLGILPLGFAVLVTNTPGTELEAGRPSDHGLDYQDVLFTTRDGVDLAGWYIPSANGAAVVLMHGSGSTRSRVLEHAVVLAEHGYGVLLYDSRGNGESDGRAMALGWFGDADTEAAVSFLSWQDDVDASRIGAVGMSMGGEQAIGAASHDHRIRAVVAEGATGRTRSDNNWMARDVGGLLNRGFGLVAYAATDLLTDASPPASLRDAVAAAAPHPVLLISGHGEVSAGRHIRDGSPATVDLWELPDTGHTKGLLEHPVSWTRRVLAFLDANLLPG